MIDGFYKYLAPCMNCNLKITKLIRPWPRRSLCIMVILMSSSCVILEWITIRQRFVRVSRELKICRCVSNWQHKVFDKFLLLPLSTCWQLIIFVSNLYFSEYRKNVCQRASLLFWQRLPVLWLSFITNLITRSPTTFFAFTLIKQ